MKHFAILLTVSAALVLAPTDALAKDKKKSKKHKDDHRECRDDHDRSSHYAERRSYYEAPRYYSPYQESRAYYAPSHHYPPTYCPPAPPSCHSRSYSAHRSSGLRFVFGF